MYTEEAIRAHAESCVGKVGRAADSMGFGNLTRDKMCELADFVGDALIELEEPDMRLLPAFLRRNTALVSYMGYIVAGECNVKVFVAVFAEFAADESRPVTGAARWKAQTNTDNIERLAPFMTAEDIEIVKTQLALRRPVPSDLINLIATGSQDRVIMHNAWTANTVTGEPRANTITSRRRVSSKDANPSRDANSSNAKKSTRRSRRSQLRKCPRV